MAIDSIIARPMKSVRLIVPASSGCWAMEPSACAMAFASPSAGPMEPIAMHRAAAAMDVIPMMPTLSINPPSAFFLPALHRGRDVDHSQDRENVGLNHPGEQPQGLHQHREEKRRDRQQNAYDHRSAHDVAEQPHRQRQVA